MAKMEGNNALRQQLSPKIEYDSDQMNSLMESYKEAWHKQVKRTFEKVLSLQKFKDIINESIFKDRQGHIKLFSESTKDSCLKTLESQTNKVFEKINLQNLNYFMFKEKYCEDVGELQFDEQEQFFKQMYKAIKAESALITSIREKEKKYALP